MSDNKRKDLALRRNDIRDKREYLKKIGQLRDDNPRSR